jgi:hypothetical protein
MGEGTEPAPAKAGVENQVGNLRDLLFRPKPRVKSLAELNAWLEDPCLASSQRHRPASQRPTRCV